MGFGLPTERAVVRASSMGVFQASDSAALGSLFVVVVALEDLNSRWDFQSADQLTLANRK